VLPLLVRLVAPRTREPPHVVASALLALGKLARTESHVRTLLAVVGEGNGRPPAVREAAVLALGLLRRSEEGERFPATLLDAVREVLFARAADEQQGTGVRARAALALGLLADQQTTGGLEGRRRHVARLLVLLHATSADLEVGGSLALALSLCPPDAFGAEQREELRSLVVNRRPPEAHVVDQVRAATAIVLGRIGTGEDAEALGRTFQSRRGVGLQTRRSAAVALGLLAARVPAADRSQIDSILVRALRRILKDATARDLATLALGHLLVAELEAGDGRGFGALDADDLLLETARKGHYQTRGFAFLALGQVLHEVPEEAMHRAAPGWRRAALDLVREAARTKRGTVRARAAAALALGLAGDVESRDLLFATFADEGLPAPLRSAAAWGLGLLRAPLTPSQVRTLTAAVSIATPSPLASAAMHALALLGHPRAASGEADAVEHVLAELGPGRTDDEQRNAIALLVHDADVRALGPLADWFEAGGGREDTRALAVAALGCVADLEVELSSLDRLRLDVCFRTVGAEVWRVFDLH